MACVFLELPTNILVSRSARIENGETLEGAVRPRHFDFNTCGCRRSVYEKLEIVLLCIFVSNVVSVRKRRRVDVRSACNVMCALAHCVSITAITADVNSKTLTRRRAAQE